MGKKNKLFFDGIYIWKQDDLVKFLTSNFNIYEIIEIKLKNNFPLSYEEKESIVLNKSDLDLSVFYQNITLEDVRNIKKQNSTPIPIMDTKNEIENIKKDFENNIATERTLIEDITLAQKEKSIQSQQEFRKDLSTALNEYEKFHTIKLHYASIPSKTKIFGYLIFILIFCLLVSLITFIF